MDEATGASESQGDASGSRYKGVRLRKWGKWVSEIRLPNSRERIWLGSYNSPEKAARAFDAALYCLRGRSVQFNFPDSPPDFPGAQGLTRQEIRAVAARFANESSGQGGRNDDGQGHRASPSAAQGGDNNGNGNDGGSNDMDWSFLTALDDNDCAGSAFGLYGGLDYACGHELAPTPEASATTNNADDEQGGGGGGEGFYCNEPSFLWNF